MKKPVLILLAIILIFGLVTVYPALFQEGNPIPIVKGIVMLSFSDDKIVQISDIPKIFISKSEVGNTPLIELLEREGWKFDEQMGSGHMFSKDGSRLIVTSVQYSRKYRIWKFS